MMEPDKTETPESEDQELSFLEHLVELRSRLLKACFAALLFHCFLMLGSQRVLSAACFFNFLG